MMVYLAKKEIVAFQQDWYTVAWYKIKCPVLITVSYIDNQRIISVFPWIQGKL